MEPSCERICKITEPRLSDIGGVEISSCSPAVAKSSTSATAPSAVTSIDLSGFLSNNL